MKSKLSLIYLIAGSLGVVGFLAFFNGWGKPLVFLYLLSIPFYLATLTYTIFIHPLICLFHLIIHIKRKQNKAKILIHLFWSLIIAIAFMIMIMNGYIITV
jgi:hypothetical protein